MISGAITRFILTSIDSVPHLEAILLLRFDPKVEWDAKTMAQRLYISEKKAAEVLANLCAAGFVSAKEGGVPLYQYSPVTVDLKEMMDQLADIYTKNLVEVTKLIHSKISKQAQQFGDAFRLQSDKE